MALQFSLDEQAHAQLPEALRDHYVKQDDGSYLLHTEGDNPEVKQLRGKVDEFRQNNISLEKRMAEAKRSGNPAENTALAEQVNKLREQMEALESEKKALETKQIQADFRSTLSKAVHGMGLTEGALPDLERRAQLDGWTMQEGNAVRLDPQGEQVRRGSLPETLGAYLNDAKFGDAKHLFRGPSGGGTDRAVPFGKNGAKIEVDASDDFVLSNLDDIASGKVVLQTTVQ